jgi:hypothetical protein
MNELTLKLLEDVIIDLLTGNSSPSDISRFARTNENRSIEISTIFEEIVAKKGREYDRGNIEAHK